jgi:hypothetical protein
MNQSSYEVLETGVAQNGKEYALVSMRTSGIAKRVIRAVLAGEACNGRAIEDSGMGSIYCGKGGRPVARVYFAAVEAAPIEAPVVVHELTIRAFAVVSIANAVQMNLFGGAL